MAIDKATMLKWLEEDEEFRDKFVMLLMRAPILVELRGLREDFNKRFEAFGEEMRALREDFNRLSAQVAENSKAVRALQEQVAEHTKAIKGLQEQVAENSRAIRALQEQVAENTKAIRGLQEQVAENTKAIRALQEQVVENSRAIRALQEQVVELREDFNKRFKAHDEEIRRLREDFNKRFEAFDEEIRRLREDFNKRFEAHEEEMRALREDFNRLARRMDRGFKKIERALSSLGVRWGLGAEEAFKRAFSSLLAELGYEVVGSLRLRDEWGVVKAGAVGREYEYDLCIKDEEMYLLEIKSRVGWWDVELFKRKLDLYERYHGRRPKLIIVSPFVEEDARREAEALGFKVFTYDMEHDRLVG
mgnify:CR=1 FL=1